jgi:hypothetical protein
MDCSGPQAVIRSLGGPCWQGSRSQVRRASCFVSRRRLGARQSTIAHKITPAAAMPVTAEKNASGMSKRSAMGIYSSI